MASRNFKELSDQMRAGSDANPTADDFDDSCLFTVRLENSHGTVVEYERIIPNFEDNMQFKSIREFYHDDMWDHLLTKLKEKVHG